MLSTWDDNSIGGGGAPFRVANSESKDCGLKCVALNSRSIVNKRYELKALLLHEKYDLVAITEIVPSDYCVYRKDRNRHGGGVMIAVRNDIPSVDRTDLDADCELKWIQLTVQEKEIIVGVFYRPPSSPSSCLQQLHNMYL